MRIAKKYAEALFEEAARAKIIDRVFLEISALSGAIFLQPKVAKALISQSKKQSSEEVLLKVIKKYSISELVSKFIKVIIRLKRIKFLPAMVNEYERLKETAAGVRIVEVISAKEVNKAEKAEIDGVIKSHFGDKIAMKYKVDSSIIGGIVAHCGSTVFDASIKGAAERILAI